MKITTIGIDLAKRSEQRKRKKSHVKHGENDVWLAHN